MLLPENHKPSNRWRTEQVESERGFRLACQNIPIGADAFTIKGFIIIYEDLLAETNAFSPRENYLDFPLAERPKQISNRKGEKKSPRQIPQEFFKMGCSYQRMPF